MKNGDLTTPGEVILGAFAVIVLGLAIFFGLPVGIHNWQITRAYWGF